MSESPVSRENFVTGKLHPRASRTLRRLVAFCSLFSVVAGLVGLAGWVFQVEILRVMWPGLVAMKANAAISLVLIGLSLWWLAVHHGRTAISNWIARAAAAIVTGVGLLSFLEFLGGWDFGIDQLFFVETVQAAVGSVRQGLMSPVTALTFILLGLALLLLDWTGYRETSPAQSLAFGSGLISLFALLDFIVRPHSFHTHIALPTVMTLCLVSLGVMCSRPERGFVGALLSSDFRSGMVRALWAAALSDHGPVGRGPLRYGWAVLFAFVATVLRSISGGFLPKGLTFITYFPAVMVVAILCGLGPGVMATLLSDVCIVYFFLEPKGQFGNKSLPELMGLLLFSCIGIGMSWLAGAVDRTRKLAQEAVAAEQQKLNNILDALPPYVVLLTPDYHVAFANREFIKRFGEADGRRCFEFLFGRSAPCEICETYKVLQAKKPLEWRWTGPDGRDYDIYDFPFIDTDGSTLILEMGIDVTDRRRAEEENFRLASIVASTDDGIIGKTLDGVITSWNRGAENIYGYTAEEAIGRHISFLVPPDRVGELAAMLEAIRRGHPVPPHDMVRVRKDGRQIDVSLTLSPIKDQSGKILGLSTTVRDITQRKRAEAALQESETKFRALSELVPQMVWACTPDGLNVYFNQRWVEYTGLTIEESYGRGWNTPFHPDDRQTAWNAWNHAVATGTIYRVESRLRGADGGYRWFLMRGVPLRDASGSIVKWFGTCTDIDDLKRAEEEIRKLNQELEQRVQERTAQLHESEQRVRRKLESILSPEGDLGSLELADILDVPALQSLIDDFYAVAHLPIGVIDLKGKVLAGIGWQDVCTKFHRANPETCKNCLESDMVLSVGAPPGEFKIYKCKNNMWDVATPIMVGGQYLGNLFTGQFFFTDEPVDYEWFRSQARKYGFNEDAYLAAMETAPRLSRESVNTSMAFLAKLAQLLSQLSYSGIKLARSASQIGRVNADLAASVKELEAFTYSVSHDLRAPLRHISGFAKILTEEFGPNLPAEAQHHVQRIHEGTRRMGILVDDLLNMARVARRDLSLRVSGLRSIVDEVLADLAPECAGRQIEWKIGDLPFVECDPGLIKQVLHNLLSNAAKFTRTRSQALIEVGQENREGKPVVFVRDNGVGFNMKYADKLFGVFQRLHRTEDFEGTGVGLATVQRIVQKHGGRIWAEAELDKGATFYFTLGAPDNFELKTKATMAGEKA